MDLYSMYSFLLNTLIMKDLSCTVGWSAGGLETLYGFWDCAIQSFPMQF